MKTMSEIEVLKGIHASLQMASMLLASLLPLAVAILIKLGEIQKLLRR